MKKSTPPFVVFIIANSHSNRGENKMIHLTPIEPEKVFLPEPSRVKSPIIHRIIEIYRFLTAKDSLKKCKKCDSNNERIRIIVTGFTIDLNNPRYPIFQPRVSNAKLIMKIPLIRWLIATPSYVDPTGWSLIKHETSCVEKACSCHGWSEVLERTGYRKFGRLRWLVIKVESFLWPEYFVLR